MATLYFLPGSAAMAPHAALEEAGAPYEPVRVERENGVTVSPPGYLSLNPHGRVPAYVDGELVLYESAAIVLHVGERHPESGVVPPPGTAARSLCYRWLVHLTNTVQPAMSVYLNPARWAGEDEAAQAAVKAEAGRQVARSFDWIDSELEGRPYLLGETFSGADLFLHMLTRWGRHLEPKAWERPNVGAHYRRLSERPSVARMLERQGIAAYPD